MTHSLMNISLLIPNLVSFQTSLIQTQNSFSRQNDFEIFRFWTWKSRHLDLHSYRSFNFNLDSNSSINIKHIPFHITTKSNPSNLTWCKNTNSQQPFSFSILKSRHRHFINIVSFLLFLLFFLFLSFSSLFFFISFPARTRAISHPRSPEQFPSLFLLHFIPSHSISFNPIPRPISSRLTKKRGNF